VGNTFRRNTTSSMCDDRLVQKDSGEIFHREIWGGVENCDEFFGSLPCVIYQCNTAFTVTNISSNSVELLGIAPDSLLGGRSFWDERVYPDDKSKLTIHVERLNQGKSECCVHRLVDDRGLPVWVSHSFRKVQATSGMCVRGCITPLLAEDCLEKLDSEIISQFVHKIGNHFQLINLLISSLRRDVVQTHEVDLLEHAVERTVEFTRTFLNYSQRLTCQSEIDLGEILKAAIQSVLPSCLAKQVSLKDIVDESNGHGVVCGDPLLLETALSALLQNAIEATNGGDAVVVQLKFDQRQYGKSGIGEISIVNTGKGIESDDLRNVTAPFFTTKRDRDGLGLTIATRIIELHGGVLKLSSHVEQGTRVEAVLPLVAAGSTSER